MDGIRRTIGATSLRLEARAVGRRLRLLAPRADGPETMATTAPMMIALAMRVRGVIGSLRMTAPSATATIGLT